VQPRRETATDQHNVTLAAEVSQLEQAHDGGAIDPGDTREIEDDEADLMRLPSLYRLTDDLEQPFR
jgi:hypothetical protein